MNNNTEAGYNNGLTKKDLIACGIPGKTHTDMKKMIEEGLLDRVVFIKLGHYLDQVPTTILKTKQYDIEHNYLYVDDADHILVSSLEERPSDKEMTGVCFWAFNRSGDGDIKTYREFLSEAHTYKGPRYAIMPYTPSKKYASKGKVGSSSVADDKLDPLDGETMEDFFVRMRGYYADEMKYARELKANNGMANSGNYAFGYSFDHQDTTICYPYPSSMYPEVISKSAKNNALLISEFYYMDASLHNKSLYESFMSHTNKLVGTTLKGQNSKCCASLIESGKEVLLDHLGECKDLKDNDAVDYILAKLEYPYIIALSNEPVE